MPMKHSRRTVLIAVGAVAGAWSLKGATSMENSHATSSGIQYLPTKHSVAETIDRLEALLKERGIKIFSRIDFAEDAKQSGLSMLPEQQLIFGNPKAGTPLMVANPIAALDLPLRVICWQDRDGKTWLAYNDLAYLQQRHGLSADLTKSLSAVTPLIERAAADN
jgi:uncharacterized protein (DUF302 family)